MSSLRNSDQVFTLHNVDNPCARLYYAVQNALSKGHAIEEIQQVLQPYGSGQALPVFSSFNLIGLEMRRTTLLVRTHNGTVTLDPALGHSCHRLPLNLSSTGVMNPMFEIAPLVVRLLPDVELSIRLNLFTDTFTSLPTPVWAKVAGSNPDFGAFSIAARVNATSDPGVVGAQLELCQHSPAEQRIWYNVYDSVDLAVLSTVADVGVIDVQTEINTPHPWKAV